ncbi:hypothetical protein [Azospirillum sp.]|uniref:hypothetical protein n=1 Tax=Azospirillum sp. TaxID=34012 RepID=UPI002D4F893E|nr:hypothetical protein [Azospirillum sp.]HYD70346.1 hypothetical protein [Azospirillum sp.]
MAIDATTFDAAASARAVQRESSYSPIVRSATEEPYDQPGEMSFLDFLDVVNPLQHIPVVGTIYRSLTGDTIKPAQQVMGGMLYGGPLGAVTSMFGAVVEQSTGKSIEGHAMAALGFEDPNNHGIAVAQAAPAAAKAAPATVAAAPVSPAPSAQTATQAAAQTATQPAMPAGAAAGAGTAAASARAPAGGTVTGPRDAFAAAAGEHRPSRMPARDTILANTMQAKHAATARTAPTPGAAAAMAAANASAAPQTAPQPAPAAAGAEGAKPVDGKSADGKSAAAPAPVPPEMLSDVMMRNLAKYEAAKKASAVRTAPAGVRVSG